MDEEIKKMQEKIETALSQAFDSIPKELWIMFAKALEESFTKVCEEKKTEAINYIADLIVESRENLFSTIRKIREQEL